jgi:hypothetical protein
MRLRSDFSPLGSTSSPRPLQRALVVFEDRHDLVTLRLLRPGFRHCFCILGCTLTWTICDPLKTRLEITPVFGPTEGELAAHFHEHGHTVLLGNVSADRSPRPHQLRALTCVEVVKRILNIDAPGALTPFQLHRTLLGLRSPVVPFVAYTPGTSQSKFIDSVHE